MTEDFALIDFALSARSPDELAKAIGEVRLAALPGSVGEAAPNRGKGLLSRLFGRIGKGAAPVSATELLLHPPGTLPDTPLMRIDLAETAGTGLRSPVRLIGPLGTAGLTLIELRDDDGETSAFCERLSGILRGDEIYYFRHSGSRHPGAHFAFHIYRDGRATRRSVSSSFDGTAPEAQWFGLDIGMPHPLEAESLPVPGAPNFEIMTPVRQASIIEALGIDPETIFIPSEDPEVVVLELASEPGGRPLAEVLLAMEEQRGLPVGEPVEPLAPPEAVWREAPASAAQGFAEAPPAFARAPWDEQKPAPSWEEEVTRLLIGVVEAALPAEEQVEWLNDLTARLLEGDVDGALGEAQRMIDAGSLSPVEKKAVSARLARFFGRS